MALSIEKRFAVDLDKPLNVQYGGGLMFTGDAGADTFEITLYKSGEEYAPGGSVALNCIRADGNTVTVAGSISGNVVTATLTQACCAIPGPLSVVMQIISGGNTGAVFAAAYTVMPAQTGEPIDPGTTISDTAALIAQIDAAVDSIPADYSDLLAAVAPTFSASTAYAAGDYVWYEGDLYKFTVAHSAGAWTGSDVTAAVFATDISELKSQITYSYQDASLWGQGYWAIADGASSSGASDWIRTNDFLSESIIRIANNTSLLMYLQAWLKSDDTYVGTWNGTAFTKTYVAGTGVTDMLFDEFLRTYPDYKYKISIKKANGAVITPSVDGATVTFTESKIDRIDSKVDALEDVTDAIKADIYSLPLGSSKTNPFIWQNGYWAIANGTYSSGSGWACSTGYIDENVMRITAPSTYYMYLMAYDNTDTYIGAWNGNEFSKTYTAGSGLYDIDLKTFRATYSGYKYKLSITAQSGTEITANTVRWNIYLYVLADIEGMQESITGNNTALDIIVTPLQMKDYYENFEISAAQNTYTSIPNTGTPTLTRARIKQEFIQEIPGNATAVHLKLTSAIFGGTKYKVSFSYFDSNFKQSWNSGWITSPVETVYTVSSSHKYYMLYIATNTAESVELETLSNDGCIVRFDVSDENYIERERIANQRILDLAGKVDEAILSDDVIIAMKSNVRVVNHRGYSSAPENTIPAFEMSVQKGYLYVETDVLFTAPDENNPLGVPVLMHDASINRTARNPDGTALSSTVYIADITYAEALEYDYGIYKGAKYAGTKIPTFAEFMAFCKANALHPFIELKNEKTYSQDEIDLILTIIKQYGMRDHVTFISYSYDALVLVQTRWDDVELGLNGTLANTLLLRTTKNRVFNLAATYAESSFIESLIENDVPICRWTIDSTSTLILLDKSYDTILTNSLTVKQVQEALEEEFNQS